MIVLQHSYPRRIVKSLLIGPSFTPCQIVVWFGEIRMKQLAIEVDF